MEFKSFLISELFTTARGKSRLTRDYARNNQGTFPIYSASLESPLGFINNWDFDGSYLSWTANGYAGHVQKLEGKFSINGDRGLLIPFNPSDLNLDYCRIIMQPVLRAQAVGRIIDGKKNEYTKLSPIVVLETSIELPVKKDGTPDVIVQTQLVQKSLIIESFQSKIYNLFDKISNSLIRINLTGKTKMVSLSDSELFSMSIGDRVLKQDIQETGVPVYSANVHSPFGRIRKSNLNDFRSPSLLWGIDGNFDWAYINEGHEFAATDHCGLLKIHKSNIHPKYVYYNLRATRAQYGFDRTFRASLSNVKDVVNIEFPINKDGTFNLEEQKTIAAKYDKLEYKKKYILDQLRIASSVSVQFA